MMTTKPGAATPNAALLKVAILDSCVLCVSILYLCVDKHEGGSQEAHQANNKHT